MAYAQIEKDEQYGIVIRPRDPDTHPEWGAPLVEVPDDLLDAYIYALETEQALREHIVKTCGTSYGDDD